MRLPSHSVLRRAVAARAAVNSLDEFEFDDEEPMERRQITVGEEHWYGIASYQAAAGNLSTNCPISCTHISCIVRVTQGKDGVCRLVGFH